MKYCNLLFFLTMSMCSFSQNTMIFDEDYFLNTISDLLDYNIDSIKLYSNNDSTQANLELFYTYIIDEKTDKTIIERKSKILVNFIDRTKLDEMNSTQIFYLGHCLTIDSIHTSGVQDGVFLVNSNSINRKIIDYKEETISSITLIENNFSDTTSTNFYYFEDLIWKVKIRKITGVNKIITNKVIYFEYYRNGKVLKQIKR